MKTVDALKKFLPLYKECRNQYLCNALNTLEMDGKLTPEELTLLRRWISHWHKRTGRTTYDGFYTIARYLPPPTNAYQRKFMELFLNLRPDEDQKPRRIEWIEYCIARYERGAK